LGLTGHACVVLAFMADGGMGLPAVIVTRPNTRLIWQLEQNLRQTVEHVLRAARLKIGAPTAVDQQGVATEQMARSIGFCGVAL
jgi:hypothetical protein